VTEAPFADPLVIQTMRQFKVELLAREHRQMQEMARAWLSVERALQDKINLLAQEAYDLSLAGKTLSRSKIYRWQRYRDLLAQTQLEYQQYAIWAGDFAQAGQVMAVETGIDHAHQSMNAIFTDYGMVMPYFERLPYEAVENMVGLAGNGQPLGELLKQRLTVNVVSKETSWDVWNRMTNTLIDSTALGRNPRVTAGLMQNDLTGGLNKAMTIARTEQMRVYRMASAQSYKKSGLVKGQKRLTAHDSRVCIGCLADEGTVYPINEPIPDHPNGRCTGVPIIVGMPEINWTSGEAWLNTQPEDMQRAILGDKRFGMWQDGADFGEFSVVKRDPVWGKSVVPAAVG